MPVSYDSTHQLFSLRTATSVYVFGVTASGRLQHLHWGSPVDPVECLSRLGPRFHSGFDPALERYEEELAGWGEAFYGEPTLKASLPGGLRDLRLSYTAQAVSREGGADILTVTLEDTTFGLRADLVYRVWPDHDIVARHTVLTNLGTAPIHLESAMSAAWTIPEGPARLTHVHGHWAGEFQLESLPLATAVTILESRKGFTSPGANPWFALDNGTATETQGQVWFGALAWSGSWKIVLESNSFGQTRATGGFHDFDFSWELQPGEPLSTPVFYGGWSDQGFGGMSRGFHAFADSSALASVRPKTAPKVLYNSWEATAFDVRVEEQKALADQAADLGIEVFVVDDGWFGARNSDRAGLGDWYPNPVKFPQGLGPLIEWVKDRGMEFGLWVEPEMVNPDSDLYRAHPDWVYHHPGREPVLARHQLVLNPAIPEVRQYLVEVLTRLLSENDIRFLKWDFNRPLADPGWPGAPVERQREVWVRHVRVLYDIWETLVNQFPHVTFESCAGGGGRVDLGMLAYADRFWPSDNTDAVDRLLIQEGYSYVYPPWAMSSWVTESPQFLNGRSVPLDYRFRMAMMGALGVGANIAHWSPQERAIARQRIAEYKDLRSLVRRAGVYRLASLRSGRRVHAVQYLTPDKSKAVVFVFSGYRPYGPGPVTLGLAGLDPGTTYVVEGATPPKASGQALMVLGITLPLKGDLASAIVRISSI